MDIRKTGNLIKELRIEKDMKQKELADKLCVSVAAVSKWENGHGFPDISVLGELCRILDISIEELMEGERSGMEKKQYSIVNDVIVIAGEKEKKQKRTIRLLTVFLVLLLIAGVLITVSSYLHHRKNYIPYVDVTDDGVRQMFIVNSNGVPTLFYNGKHFDRINDVLLRDRDGDMYLLVSIETNSWNQYFSASEERLLAFSSFLDLNSANSLGSLDQQKSVGVYLYEGDLWELLKQYNANTKISIQNTISHCTRIPYYDDLLKQK